MQLQWEHGCVLIYAMCSVYGIFLQNYTTVAIVRAEGKISTLCAALLLYSHNMQPSAVSFINYFSQTLKWIHMGSGKIPQLESERDVDNTATVTIQNWESTDDLSIYYYFLEHLIHWETPNCPLQMVIFHHITMNTSLAYLNVMQPQGGGTV